MASIATLPRISAATLSEIVLSHSTTSNMNAIPPLPIDKIAIIDVRDDDHVGGHIRGSTHVPSSTLDYKMPELVRKLRDTDVVVFHCALSQQRGPTAALRYLRERERIVGTENEVGNMMKKSRAENEDRDAKGQDGWADVEENLKPEQIVYVLDKGFVGWQEKYGENRRLTESYSKELWREGGYY